MVPGLAVCAIATVIALTIKTFVAAVSPLLIAIALGVTVSNTVGVARRWTSGLHFASSRLLRLGVALLGTQLVLADILGLGIDMVLAVMTVVGMGIVGTMLTGRLLGLTWTQRLLVACGFSICGAAAVAAVGTVVDADEDETAAAIALVVMFGTLMIVVIPATSVGLGLDDRQAGLFAGGSIHEVAQVVAAGGAIGGGALGVAIIIKLARVLMLAPVIAVLALRQRRRASASSDIASRPRLIPLFVVGFLSCVALRSSGALPEQIVTATANLQSILLTAAMFALGASVRVAALRSIGTRLFTLAAASTVWVSSIALAGVLLAT